MKTNITKDTYLLSPLKKHFGTLKNILKYIL